ncbi:hypothetical protein, partial [Escherichia coli]
MRCPEAHPTISTRVSTSRPDAITRLSSSEPASDTSLAVAPAQQNKSTIVRLRSFVCIADDAPEKRVNMSSPERYVNPLPRRVHKNNKHQTLPDNNYQPNGLPQSVLLSSHPWSLIR